MPDTDEGRPRTPLSTEALFLGTPVQGFTKGEDLRAAWMALFGTLKPVGLSVISEIEIPETGFAFADLKVKAEIGAEGWSRGSWGPWPSMRKARW